MGNRFTYARMQSRLANGDDDDYKLRSLQADAGVEVGLIECENTEQQIQSTLTT